MVEQSVQTEEAEKRINLAIEHIAHSLEEHFSLAVQALVTTDGKRDYAASVAFIENLAHNAREELIRKNFGGRVRR